MTKELGDDASMADLQRTTADNAAVFAVGVAGIATTDDVAAAGSSPSTADLAEGYRSDFRLHEYSCQDRLCWHWHYCQSRRHHW